ncbi:YheC/YheD family protein [Aureibacillus halotolerans]|uniref:YheC/D-like protein n=1 Tax=Aureibacillus halotolerans TaxID=1508390 RepID=A0A4R6TYU6_9BACI|nr:YheC/YheD family protein [Aureibacillus halotolerans]TDQ35405.1 YheC/D-like protein [Aureibacillus halotolerans]
MSQHFRLLVEPSDDLFFHLPKTLLSIPEQLSITFGNQQRSVKCQTNTTDELLISQALQNQLRLPATLTEVPLWLDSDEKSVKIGPLVGIVTAGFMDDANSPLGKRSAAFKQLLQHGITTGVLPFVFGHHHVDWQALTVTAWTLVDDEWERATFPFPEVIYDKIPNRQIEERYEFTALRYKTTKELHIPWFNNGFFNKEDIYAKLLQGTKTKALLPETLLSPDRLSAEAFLEKYDTVYIKPSTGSFGRGIFYVTKEDKGQYACAYYSQDKTIQKHGLSFSQLFAIISDAGIRLDGCVLQEGIALHKHQGRPVDYRVHMNKDEKGVWQLSGIAAKLALVDNPTTHIKHGGTVLPAEHVLGRDASKRDKKNKMIQQAFDVCQWLDHHYNEEIGEIGIDMAESESQQWYVIEVNSKPGKSAFSHPALSGELSTVQKMPFAYAKHLSKQNRKRMLTSPPSHTT